MRAIPTPCVALLRATPGDPEAPARILAMFRDDLRQRHAAGATATETAAQFGVSVWTAAKWMRDAGIKMKRGAPRGRCRKDTIAGRDAQIITDARRCGNGAEVAAKYGLTRERVRQICVRYGGFTLAEVRHESDTTKKARAREQRKADRAALVADVLAAYDGGMSRAAINAQWGFKRGQLDHILKVAGRRERMARCSRDADVLTGLQEGLGPAAIARRCGINPLSVHYIVARLRKRGQWSAPTTPPQSAAA